MDVFDKIIDDLPLTEADEAALDAILAEPSLPVNPSRLMEPGYLETVSAAFGIVEEAKAKYPGRTIVFDPDDLEVRILGSRPGYYVVYARAAANPNGSQVRVFLRG